MHIRVCLGVCVDTWEHVCAALSECIYSTRTVLNVWVSSGSHDKMTPTRRLKTTDLHPPGVLETRCPRSRGPRAGLHPESPEEGPSRPFQLLGAPGIRPWAGVRLPPVSASASTWLLRCVCVSPLLCLIRTLSLGLGPPPPRRTSSQTVHSVTSAETLFPHKEPF